MPQDINLSGPPYPNTDYRASTIIESSSQFNYWDTIMSQYANSESITTLIGAFFAAADQTTNIENFYDDVWNVETAKDYGLDVWGRIVGVSRVYYVPFSGWFGFSEGLPSSMMFNTGSANQSGGPFYSGGALTQNYRLSTETYRKLILAKAAFNISDCSIKAINQLLLSLFPGRGNAYVAESAMHMTYTFDFALTPTEQTIVMQSGVLPKPTGVQVSVSTA